MNVIQIQNSVTHAGSEIPMVDASFIELVAITGGVAPQHLHEGLEPQIPEWFRRYGYIV